MRCAARKVVFKGYLAVIKCVNVPILPGSADFSGSKAASAEVVKQNPLSIVFKNILVGEVNFTL